MNNTILYPQYLPAMLHDEGPPFLVYITDGTIPFTELALGGKKNMARLHIEIWWCK
jgi:hypothetical protein